MKHKWVILYIIGLISMFIGMYKYNPVIVYLYGLCMLSSGLLMGEMTTLEAKDGE